MAPSVNWSTKVVTIPQGDLTLVSGTTYEYDVNTLRLALKNIEDDEAGVVFTDTHKHTPPVTLGGVTYARQVEILSPYTLTFADGQYGVNIIGGNSNIADKLNRNQVSVNTANSGGLVLGEGGSAPTAAQIADAVWDEASADHTTAGSEGKLVRELKQFILAVMAK